MTARCECSRPSFRMLACLVGVPANPLRRRVLCGNISEVSRQGFDWVDGARDSDSRRVQIYYALLPTRCVTGAGQRPLHAQQVAAVSFGSTIFIPGWMRC